ncbi:MAG TPA: hypothetical protein VGH90_03800 [Chthoniobacteraceae bacterium]|jgi:hypothetical protein
MKIIACAVVTSCACLFTLLAQNTGPAELNTARTSYETGVTDLHKRIIEAKSKRNAKYAGDLKQLESQIAATGNLDAALAVKSEMEAYQSGATTTGLDPKNSAAPAAARTLRAAFDADLDKISKYAANEERNLDTNYIRQLEELERKLTMAQRVDDAVAVRTEKTQTQNILANTAASSSPIASSPPAAANPGTTPVELSAAAAEYKAQQTAIESEIEPKLSARDEKYKADVDALVEKLTQSKHGKEAEKAKAEAKRFQEHGINSEIGKDALPELRSLWSAYLRDIAEIQQSVAIKRSGGRSRLAQILAPLEIGYRKKNDSAGLEAVKRVRATLTIGAAIEGSRIATTEFAGKPGGEPWQDLAKEGGYVVGFKAGSGGWFQFTVLGSVIPIFATAEGTRDGVKRGNHGTPDTVLAKDGYAVGGIVARSGEVVNCFQVIFMRINPDGVSLNPQDNYVSDWLGGKDGGPPKEISAHGHMIVGLSGRTENEVVSLALIYVK